MESASVKQKTKNWAKGKGLTSSVVPRLRHEPGGSAWNSPQGQGTGDRAPPLTLSPKSSRELRRAAVGCFSYIPQPRAQGWVLGRDSGCTCWIRHRPRVQESSPGPAARRGVGPASSWGGAAGARGGRNEVGGGEWQFRAQKRGCGANPYFLFHPGCLSACC